MAKSLILLLMALLALTVLPSAALRLSRNPFPHLPIFVSQPVEAAVATDENTRMQHVEWLNVATQPQAPISARFHLAGPFGELSPEEFAARVLMPPRPAVAHSPVRFRVPRTDTPLPDSFDWRAMGAVTSVKDQGYLGTCWAFSTVENLEGQLFLQGGDLIALSVEQLVECDAAADPEKGNADCGEFGGWPYLAYDSIRASGGIYSDEDFPYCSGIPYGEPGNCMPCMASGYSTKYCGNHKDLVRIP
mmetsp:Transcript_27438/g.70527  ORF Transcript_27438/g.70527 Transcript_27438/m.70527 type:complete len:247 (+) Transcript_27438:124-864(+)